MHTLSWRTPGRGAERGECRVGGGHEQCPPAPLPLLGAALHLPVSLRLPVPWAPLWHCLLLCIPPPRRARRSGCMSSLTLVPGRSPLTLNLGPWTLLSMPGSSTDPGHPSFLEEFHPWIHCHFPSAHLRLASQIFTSSLPHGSHLGLQPHSNVQHHYSSLPASQHPNPHPLSFPSPHGPRPHPLTSTLGSRIRHNHCFFPAPTALQSHLCFPLAAPGKSLASRLVGNTGLTVFRGVTTVDLRASCAVPPADLLVRRPLSLTRTLLMPSVLSPRSV